MCFILKHQQPWTCNTIHIDRNTDGTGIDLFTLIEVIDLSLFFQCLCADRRKIPQGHRFFRIFAIQFPAKLLIFFIGFPNRFGIDRDILQDRIERRMPAVIAPVGIDHPDLRHRRIPVFFLPEVTLQEHEIRKIHRQPERCTHGRQFFLILRCESFQHFR